MGTIPVSAKLCRTVLDTMPPARNACASFVAIALTLVLLVLAVPGGASAIEDRAAAGEARAEGVKALARIGFPLQRGMFLLASPALGDPRFAQTVVLLLEYDETGALGLVVNRPTELSLHDVLESPLPNSAEHIIFSGGPVEHRRLIALLRSTGAIDGAERVVGDIHASGSVDTLGRMLERDSHASDVHTYLGYAGWSAGQLDVELARGDWIVTPADATSIFDTPSVDVWRNLMRRNAGRWVRIGSVGSA